MRVTLHMTKSELATVLAMVQRVVPRGEEEEKALVRLYEALRGSASD